MTHSYSHAFTTVLVGSGGGQSSSCALEAASPSAPLPPPPPRLHSIPRSQSSQHPLARTPSFGARSLAMPASAPHSFAAFRTPQPVAASSLAQRFRKSAAAASSPVVHATSSSSSSSSPLASPVANTDTTSPAVPTAVSVCASAVPMAVLAADLDQNLLLASMGDPVSPPTTTTATPDSGLPSSASTWSRSGSSAGSGGTRTRRRSHFSQQRVCLELSDDDDYYHDEAVSMAAHFAPASRASRLSTSSLPELSPVAASSASAPSSPCAAAAGDDGEEFEDDCASAPAMLSTVTSTPSSMGASTPWAGAVPSTRRHHPASASHRSAPATVMRTPAHLSDAWTPCPAKLAGAPAPSSSVAAATPGQGFTFFASPALVPTPSSDVFGTPRVAPTPISIAPSPAAAPTPVPSLRRTSSSAARVPSPVFASTAEPPLPAAPAPAPAPPKRTLPAGRHWQQQQPSQQQQPPKAIQRKSTGRVPSVKLDDGKAPTLFRTRSETMMNFGAPVPAPAAAAAAASVVSRKRDLATFNPHASPPPRPMHTRSSDPMSEDDHHASAASRSPVPVRRPLKRTKTAASLQTVVPAAASDDVSNCVMPAPRAPSIRPPSLARARTTNSMALPGLGRGAWEYRPSTMLTTDALPGEPRVFGSPAPVTAKGRGGMVTAFHGEDRMDTSSSSSAVVPAPALAPAPASQHHNPATPHLLESTVGKSDSLRRITPATLVDVLDGRVPGVEQVHVLDCRFPFEYEGGHIRGAANVNRFEDLDALFLSQPRAMRSTVLVFHCEFSSKRAPDMAKHLRAQDRILNLERYPTVFYPEIYVLEGGYKQFFEEFPNRCDPMAYLPMDATEFTDQCRQETAMRKLSRTTSQNSTDSFRPSALSRSRSSVAVPTAIPASPVTAPSGMRSFLATSSSSSSSSSLNLAKNVAASPASPWFAESPR
ncbi:m-phase inducer phosphatase [Blastocladiella emersonii ATCC 22665]|nr:m-phase inducer phosphatase [Blastocladiella emersonii ATCC 22665]